MSINFISHNSHLSKGLSKHKPEASHKFSKQYLKYMLVSCGITIMVFAYPSWTLAKKYQLLSILNTNVDQIDKLNSDDENFNLKNLESNLDDTLSKAQTLQELDNVTSDEDLEQLVNQYNQLVTEYSDMLKKYDTDIQAQDIFQKQHVIYEELDINVSITADISIGDVAELNIDLAEKKQWIERLAEAQTDIDELHNQFTNLSGLSDKPEMKKMINNHKLILTENMTEADVDGHAIISISKHFIDIYTDLDDINPLSQDQEIDEMSTALKDKGQLFKDKSKMIRNDITASDRTSDLINSISDFLLEAGQAYISIADKIENNVAISIDDVSKVLSMEQNIEFANKKIIDYYSNMEYAYQVQYQEMAENIINTDLQKELDLKKNQLEEIKIKLEIYQEELQDSGLLKIIQI